MKNQLGLVIGAGLVLISIIAVRAVIDRERPRLVWAKRCLVLLAIAAALAGVMTGFEVSGRGTGYFRPAQARHTGASLRGITVGLFAALWLSGQMRAKDPPA